MIDYPTWTLAELTARLADQPQNNLVQTTVSGLKVSGLSSWRGRYEELQVCLSEYDRPPMKVSDLLRECRAADGMDFQGYKGGDFTMHSSTPVWLCEYGRADERGIVALRSRDGVTTLIGTDAVQDLVDELDRA
jgi:hypothetical protein